MASSLIKDCLYGLISLELIVFTYQGLSLELKFNLFFEALQLLLYSFINLSFFIFDFEVISASHYITLRCPLLFSLQSCKRMKVSIEKRTSLSVIKGRRIEKDSSSLRSLASRYGAQLNGRQSIHVKIGLLSISLRIFKCLELSNVTSFIEQHLYSIYSD